jgi:tetratricopeptide (TPR) repeat protein
MDLRMTCLNERLAEAQSLTALLSQANADVLKNAVPAVESLAQLSRCEDVAALKAVIKPPADPAARKQVEQLTHDLAAARAAMEAGSRSELQRQLAVLEPKVASAHYPPLTASLLHLKAILLFWTGSSQAATEVGESALWAAEASRDDRLSSDILNRLAYSVRYGTGDLAQGHRWLKLHQAVLDRMGGNPLRQAWLAMDQASYAWLDGEGQKAVELERFALDLKLRVLPADDIDVAKSWGNLANALEDVGAHGEALQANSKALDIQLQKLGEHHPDVALNQNNRGEILLALGRVNEAKDLFSIAAKTFTEAFGTEHAFLAYPLYGLGLAWLKLGNVDYALAPLEQALTIRRKVETDPERVAEAELALAQALWAKSPDQRARARALASEAEVTLSRFRKTSAHLAEARLWLKAHQSS